MIVIFQNFSSFWQKNPKIPAKKIQILSVFTLKVPKSTFQTKFELFFKKIELFISSYLFIRFP